MSLSHSATFWNLTDVTLADEDTNAILTDNANRVIQGNAMWQFKWRNMVANFENNASGASWWPNMQLMQMAPYGGQICNKCKWCHMMAKFETSASGAKY